ncbi:MAG: sensor histidine kinase [Christensenellales bacterium]
MKTASYNCPGGSVTVSIRQEEAMAVLHVSDTGMGIPPEYRDSVFQPFFRIDKSRSRKMGGVGLGLALVREIAVLHGGSVAVESSPTAERPLGSPCRRSRMVDFISIFHILTCGNDKSHRIDRWLLPVYIAPLCLSTALTV